MSNDNNKTPIGAIDVGALRKESGLTQVELAQLADCSISMVRLLEAGHRPKSSAVLDRVLAVLDRA